MAGKRNRSSIRTATAFVLAAAISVPGFASAASAKIRCDGPYQLTSGGSVSTPYCEADKLARVARSRGIQVSAVAIRSDYGTLKRTCMLLHGDTRVSGTCQPFTEAP